MAPVIVRIDIPVKLDGTSHAAQEFLDACLIEEAKELIAETAVRLGCPAYAVPVGHQLSIELGISN
jgi:ABC-type sulfate transport system substrate-binding protein